MSKVIPLISIEAENIPQAHYRATKAVFKKGMNIRTQYDRKKGTEFIDPESKDARAAILITNPFNQPRYPRISYCDRGAYIAEILGVKDHLVIPFNELKEGIAKGSIPNEWPYTYSQRLTNYPTSSRLINQFDILINRIAENSETRRAVAMTGLPEVDLYLKEDLPCLREVHLRCTEDKEKMFLHMSTTWRSRDLFKAWPDNVLGLTFLQARLADELSKKLGKPVEVGSYSDYSTSLHIYGQDISTKGVKKYIDAGEEENVKRSYTSEFAKENVVIPDLEKLLEQKEMWHFTQSNIDKIQDLITGLKEGRYIA